MPFLGCCVLQAPVHAQSLEMQCLRRLSQTAAEAVKARRHPGHKVCSLLCFCPRCRGAGGFTRGFSQPLHTAFGWQAVALKADV